MRHHRQIRFYAPLIVGSLATFLLCTVCVPGWAQLKRVAPDTKVASVTVEELSQALGTGTAPLVIDVRLEEDYEADPKRIGDADWRDPHQIEEWAKAIKPNTKVVVYCVAGRWVSQSVTKRLAEMGLDAAQLDGGIEAWTEAGRPTTRLIARRLGIRPQNVGKALASLTSLGYETEFVEDLKTCKINDLEYLTDSVGIPKDSASTSKSTSTCKSQTTSSNRKPSANSEARLAVARVCPQCDGEGCAWCRQGV